MEGRSKVNLDLAFGSTSGRRVAGAQVTRARRATPAHLMQSVSLVDPAPSAGPFEPGPDRITTIA